MTAFSWERNEWNRAHDSASDADWHDPADRDVDPVEVTPEQVAAWRAGYERALRDERVERVLTVWTDRYPHDDKVVALARQVRNALGAAS